MFFHISTGKNCNLLFDTSRVVSDLSDVKTDGGKNSRRLSCNCISSNQGQLYTPAPPKFSTDFENFLLVLFGMINGAGSCSNLFFDKFNCFKLCIWRMLVGRSVKSLFETSRRVIACNDTYWRKIVNADV